MILIFLMIRMVSILRYSPNITYIENVSEHKKQSNEHRHSSGNYFRRHQKAYPRHNHEQSRWQIVNIKILSFVPFKIYFNSSNRKVAKITIYKYPLIRIICYHYISYVQVICDIMYIYDKMLSQIKKIFTYLLLSRK